MGAVAQLGERVDGIHEVAGSIPVSSTKYNVYCCLDSASSHLSQFYNAILLKFA